jgi:hypothetical protein
LLTQGDRAGGDNLSVKYPRIKIWRGGDAKKARMRATNVKRFLSNHFKKEGKRWKRVG